MVQRAVGTKPLIVGRALKASALVVLFISFCAQSSM